MRSGHRQRQGVGHELDALVVSFVGDPVVPWR